MDVQALRKAGPFHHDILLPGGGVTTPETHRMRFFEEAFWPSILNLTGGSLAGKRVLDVGCNCGGFSFLAARSGADEVTGIDVRQSHVDQAEFLRGHLGMHQVRFEAADLVSFASRQEPGAFDIVLLMGVMYHFADPIGAFRAVSQLASQHVVIDAHVHYSTDPQREEMPLWWMLADTDRGEVHDLNVQSGLFSVDAYLAAEAQVPVDYSRARDAYVPGPHAARDLEIARRVLTDPNAPGPEADSERSDLSAPFSMVPNRKALVKLVRAYGFPHVSEVIPPRLAEPRYALRHRAVLLASRGV
jgi:SAM-dependent methyltransferase